MSAAKAKELRTPQVRYDCNLLQIWAKRAGNSGKNTVIELEDVAYSYGGAELFAGLNLTLAPGSFHFLTGPSGAGIGLQTWDGNNASEGDDA